jgi:excisionase family DNA binding protein
MMQVSEGVSAVGDDEPRRKTWKPPAASVPKGTPALGYPQRLDRSTAAQLLGISYPTLVRLTDSGAIPESAIYRIGTRVIYDRDALLAWRPKKKGA